MTEAPKRNRVLDSMLEWALGDPDPEPVETTATGPICTTCGDTHRMLFHRSSGQVDEVMCTFCPSPCEACRSRGPGRAGGPYCATTPCLCSCHAGHHQYRARAETVLPPPAWTPPVLFTSPPCASSSTTRCEACEGRGKVPVPLLSRIFWLLAAGWEAFLVRELPCFRCAGSGRICFSCGDARDLCRCSGVQA